MSYDPNTPSNPSYPPPPQNYGDGTTGGNPPYGQPGYGNQPAYGSAPGYGNAPAYGGGPGDYPGGQAQPGNGLAIAGFVVALVSIIFTGLIGIIMAIVAGVLSFVGLQRAKQGAKYRGLALAGVIISAIVIVLSIILIIVGVGIVMSNN